VNDFIEYKFDDLLKPKYMDIDGSDVAVLGVIDAYTAISENFQAGYDEFISGPRMFNGKLKFDSERTGYSIFALELIRNNPELKEEIRRKLKVSKIIIPDPLSVSLSCLKNTAGSILEKLTLYYCVPTIKAYRKQQRVNAYTLHSIVSFCCLRIQYETENGRLCEFNDASFIYDADRPFSDNVRGLVNNCFEANSKFMSIVNDTHYNSFITDFMAGGGSFEREMPPSNFNKMVTCMNSFNPGQILKLRTIQRQQVEYVSSEELKQIQKVINRTTALDLKTLKGFSVTHKGIKFIIESMSGAYIRRRHYTNAFRFKVQIQAMRIDMCDIVELNNENKPMYPENCLRFYNAMIAVDAYRMVMDKLETTAMGRL